MRQKALEAGAAAGKRQVMRGKDPTPSSPRWTRRHGWLPRQPRSLRRQTRTLPHQAVLLDAFPREKQGAAMTMFGIAALLGPIVGPTLGGWLWPRVVMIVGLSLIFAPINVAAFPYTPKHLRGAAVGLLALLRNEGGSFGTSMGQTIQQRREQFHLSRLGESLSPLNSQVQSFLERGHTFFTQQSGDAVQSQEATVQVLASLRQQQAAALAYFDVFWICAVVGVLLVLLVFFMKRSVAEKGTHIGAE